jgi:hypothetical protein
MKALHLLAGGLATATLTAQQGTQDPAAAAASRFEVASLSAIPQGTRLSLLTSSRIGCR